MYDSGALINICWNFVFDIVEMWLLGSTRASCRCGVVRFRTLWWSLLVLSGRWKHCTSTLYQSQGLSAPRLNSLWSHLLLDISVCHLIKTNLFYLHCVSKKTSWTFLALTPANIIQLVFYQVVQTLPGYLDDMGKTAFDRFISWVMFVPKILTAG